MEIKKKSTLFSGFSLIEMLVVFSIIGTTLVGSMAAFSSYNREQAFRASVADVASLLNIAKSRAMSHVKPTECGSQPLIGYQVSLSGQIYRLRVVCNGTTYIIQSKNLRNDIAFAPGTIFVNFAVATGTVTPSPINIVITATGVTKTITINQTGVISIQ